MGFDTYRGYLFELAGLKSLKSFSLGVDFWMGIGQAEVEFMHGHWPLLCEIKISGTNVSRVHEQAHWQWLLRKRPCLRFCAQECQIR